MEDKKFEEELNKQVWINAKTYTKIAPHEYFIKFLNRELFKELKKRIREQGVDGYFYKQKNRYYYHKGYKYWGYKVVMNRDSAGAKYE